jgi:hypothetical protein
LGRSFKDFEGGLNMERRRVWRVEGFQEFWFSKVGY